MEELHRDIDFSILVEVAYPYFQREVVAVVIVVFADFAEGAVSLAFEDFHHLDGRRLILAFSDGEVQLPIVVEVAGGDARRGVLRAERDRRLESAIPIAQDDVRNVS